MAWQIPNGDTPPNIAGILLPRIDQHSADGQPFEAGLLVTRNFCSGRRYGRTAHIPCLRQEDVRTSGKPNCPRARRRRCR